MPKKKSGARAPKKAGRGGPELLGLGLAVGSNCHFLVRSRPGALSPLAMKSPVDAASTGSGRWTPS